MILRFLLVFFACFLFSCSVKKKETEFPPGLISQDSMAVILADIHAVEALINHGLLINNNAPATASAYYEGVYRKNKVSRKRFEESYNFYKENPEVLSKIYDKAIEELSSRQGKLMGKN